MLRGSLFSDLLCYLGSAHPTPRFTRTEGGKARRQARQGRGAPGRGRGRQCARLASAPSCRPAQSAVGGHERRITHGGAGPRPAQRRRSAPLRSRPRAGRNRLLIQRRSAAPPDPPHAFSCRRRDVHSQASLTTGQMTPVQSSAGGEAASAREGVPSPPRVTDAVLGAHAGVLGSSDL